VKSEELQKERDFLNRLVEATNALIAIVDTVGKVTYINEKGTRILERKKEEIVGKNWLKHLAPEEWGVYGHEVFKKLQRKQLPNCYIHSLSRQDGTQRILSCNAFVLQENKGDMVGLLCVAQDITGIEGAKRELRRLIYTDYLTGLYNTRYLYKKMGEETEKSKRYKDAFSLLYVDIDNFKHHNDVYGHRSGDQLLQKFSEILNSQLREKDSAFRYGGEEFIVLLPQTRKEKAWEVAVGLRKNVEQQLSLDYGITVSIGVAQYQPGKDVIEQADQAMYRAKREQKNRVCVFSEKQEIRSYE